jgi:hypothetical protein
VRNAGWGRPEEGKSSTQDTGTHAREPSRWRGMCRASHGKRRARPSSCLPCHCRPNRISRDYEVRPIYRQLFTARPSRPSVRSREPIIPCKSVMNSPRTLFPRQLRGRLSWAISQALAAASSPSDGVHLLQSSDTPQPTQTSSWQESGGIGNSKKEKKAQRKKRWLHRQGVSESGGGAADCDSVGCQSTRVSSQSAGLWCTEQLRFANPPWVRSPNTAGQRIPQHGKGHMFSPGTAAQGSIA